jgi:hypothetical protein
MVHLIGIPALVLLGGILDRLFFNKAKAAVTNEVNTVATDVANEVKKI